jgi:hypothetical protein
VGQSGRRFGENCILRNFKIYALQQTLSECQIAKDEISRNCGTRGRRQKFIRQFRWDNILRCMTGVCMLNVTGSKWDALTDGTVHLHVT